ncbi:MAG: mandelate racemase/muconate lactonizing enzyme family protein [Bryobacteraceae bacterium]
MQRRTFLHTLLAGAGGVALGGRLAHAALPKMKITRVRYYSPGKEARAGVPSLTSSANVICIDTDAGLTGIGEGGTKDTLEHCASALIGQDPGRIDTLWQNMFRGAFYPAGLEKLHALGGLDMALWDIKGKALGVPVYALLGGPTRELCECYGGGGQGKTSIKEAARASMEAGFKAFRTEVIGPGLSGTGTSSRGAKNWNAHQAVLATFKRCQEAREGVGEEGDFICDFHAKLDMSDSITLATMLEPLRPYFCEDLLRNEALPLWRTIRERVKVPLATGNAGKLELRALIEEQLIDYARVRLPNLGGITEYMKIAAMCETHFTGLIPEGTGPISTAAEVHVAAATNVPFLLQVGGPGTRPYLPQCYDFRQGKVYVNERPGLGVEFDPKEATPIAEVTQPGNLGGMTRPDGSYTNW